VVFVRPPSRSTSPARPRAPPHRDGWLDATWPGLRQNRRYGGFVVHLGILVVALGVRLAAWSTQTEPR